MGRIQTSSKIYIKKSKIPGAGRGVFAKYDIKKGELIEKCPIILVPTADTSKLNKSILVTYFFYFGKNKGQLLVALGFGSIYDHSYNPNATYKIKTGQKLIEFSAIKNIKKGEEITVNYKFGNPKDKTPLWFEEEAKHQSP